MNERVLPGGWVEATLGQVVTKPQYGYTTKASHHGSVKFLRTTDITKGKLNWEAVPFCHEEPDDIDKFRLNKGDVVISRAGSVGFSYLIEDVVEDAVFASYLIRFRPAGNLDSRFVKRYLQSPFYWEQLKDRAAGNALPNVNAKKLTTLRVDIPPLAEQKLIADKLDKLLAQVANLKARLDAIPAILKRFRQSVLAAALSGSLAESSESGSDHGEVVCIGDLAVDIRYGTSKKCSASKGSTAVLRIPNIVDGSVDKENLKYADFDEKEHSRLALKEGDLLLIRSNGSVDLVGRLAVVSNQDVDFLFAGYLIRLRLDTCRAVPKFVALCLQSPKLRSVIEEKAKSTSGVNNINSKELASLEIPFPTVIEQKEIVRRVNRLFAFADQIEQQVKNAQARVNKLSQSILAKAFRGELTAEWRAENPELISGEHSAEALLARIKAEKAAISPKRRSRKSKVSA